MKKYKYKMDFTDLIYCLKCKGKLKVNIQKQLSLLMDSIEYPVSVLIVKLIKMKEEKEESEMS